MKGFLAFLLIISLIVNAVLICGKSVTEPITGGNGNSSQTISTEKLRSIATKCGVSSESADKMDAEQLLTEINIKFNESVGYYGNSLSDEEFKKVEDLLYGEDKIIAVIKAQDAFVQKIHGKDIVILQ